MLKIFHARLQHDVNQDVQPGFRKGRGTRDQIANILLHYRESKGTSEKHLFLFHQVH